MRVRIAVEKLAHDANRADFRVAASLMTLTNARVRIIFDESAIAHIDGTMAYLGEFSIIVEGKCITKIDVHFYRTLYYKNRV